MARMILFDIDGTLLDSGGAGSRSLFLAFRKVLGISNATEGISMAGKTDLQIIREILFRHGLPSDNGFGPALLAAYADSLMVEILSAPKSLKPGVVDILRRLSQTPEVHVGLLTGNVRVGASIKLGAFGIEGFFNLKGTCPGIFGAFGCDHEDRNRLLPIATDKFSRISGWSIPFAQCTIVGDTPRDVECTKPYGAYSVAVATGPYPASELKDAGADVVLEDLTVEKALQALLG